MLLSSIHSESMHKILLWVTGICLHYMYILSYHTPYLTYEKFSMEFAKVEFNILQDFINDNSLRCDNS